MWIWTRWSFPQLMEINGWSQNDLPDSRIPTPPLAILCVGMPNDKSSATATYELFPTVRVFKFSRIIKQVKIRSEPPV